MKQLFFEVPNCQKEIDVVSKAWKVPAMARRYSPARPWGREPGADQQDQLLDRESVREHQRLGAAAPRAAVIRGRPPMTSGPPSVRLSEQGEDDGGPKNDAKPHKPENCNSLPPAGSFHAVTKQQAGLVHSSRIPGVTIPHYLNNYRTKASAQELELELFRCSSGACTNKRHPSRNKTHNAVLV